MSENKKEGYCDKLRRAESAFLGLSFGYVRQLDRRLLDV